MEPLFLESIGLVVEPKKPMDGAVASFITELFGQSSIASAEAFLEKDSGRLRIATVQFLMEIASIAIEHDGHRGESAFVGRLALLAARSIGDEALVCEALALAGFIEYKRGNFEEALSFVGQAQEGFEKLGLTERATEMHSAATACRAAQETRTYCKREACDLCGRVFACTDGEHMVLSRKPETMEKAAHCSECGIVVCFQCAQWRQSERVAALDSPVGDIKTPYCPLCKGILG